MSIVGSGKRGKVLEQSFPRLRFRIKKDDRGLILFYFYVAEIVEVATTSRLSRVCRGIARANHGTIGNMPEFSEKGISGEERERLRKISRIRNQLNMARDIVLQESFGGNAGRSIRGRLQAGLNAFVNNKTGEIVAVGNEMKKELLENPDLSGVIFTYEAGENSFESGEYINVQPNGLGALLSEEIEQLLKGAIRKQDETSTS